MKAEFREVFLKDLRSIKDKPLLKKIDRLIKISELAREPFEIPGIKKLVGGSSYYRVRLGDYRVGLYIAGPVVTFVRVLHRKEIYRFFP